MVCSSSSSKHNTGKASERANRNRMSKRRPRLGAARRAAPKGSHERLLGRPNPPDELGGNSPHCAGDRVLESTEDVGGGCEAARGAKRGAGEVLETTEGVGPKTQTQRHQMSRRRAHLQNC